ncbi:MAG: formate dehydrogenase accessory sulfurtransferase FdhD [Xanthomonadales bacterium]|nr:formate dehydrogenase accessory sulfurtransferase FdhD [Xanthomonadales bacterium]
MSTSSVVPVEHWRLGADSARQDAARERPGAAPRGSDHIAAEVPVAMTYNRHAHVVMMATPDDFEDFGLGFSLTEGIIGSASDLLSVKVLPRDGGVELAMTITEAWYDRLQTQRRNMTGRTGCGLCGAERIDQALRYPEAVENRVQVSHRALQRAVSDMTAHQPLQSVTGATHGAAWCDLSGEVVELREDVGRHNALDKLIGCLARAGFDPQQGFVLVSSRASYEMVYKAAAVGMEVIMAVSAPTTLAVDFAQRSGMTLVGFARPGRHNIYTFPDRIQD